MNIDLQLRKVNKLIEDNERHLTHWTKHTEERTLIRQKLQLIKDWLESKYEPTA
jgi:hypothetical protein